MKIEHLSVSRANLYLQCPLRYAFRYDLPEGKRPPDLPSIHLEKGSAMHEALAEALEHYQKTGEWSIRKLHSCWEKHGAKHNLGLKLIDDGKRLFTVWGKRYKPPEKILDIERRWEVEVDGIPIVMVIDMVEEFHENGRKILKITDWKSNQFPYSQEVLEEDLQAPMYLHQMKTEYPGYDEYRFVFDFVFQNTELPYDMDEDTIETAVRYLLEVHNTIADDKKPKATPNSFCGSCVGATHAMCPILKQMEAAGMIDDEFIKRRIDEIGEEMWLETDNNELAELVKRDKVLSDMERFIKARKGEGRKSIAGIMEHQSKDREDLGSMRISYKPWEKREYRVVDVLRVIGNKPLMLEQVLSIKKTALKNFKVLGKISDEDFEVIEKNVIVSLTRPNLKIYPSKRKKKEETSNDEKNENPWG